MAAVAVLAACDGVVDDASPNSPTSPLPNADGIWATGVPQEFDKNLILTDSFFSASDALDATDVQQFFVNTPYGTRSWLADAYIGNELVSTVLVDIAIAHDINPLVLVGRMQGEQSLVAATEAPTGRRVDFAFGCGCYDNQPCNEAYRGLDKQLECAATTLERWYQGSQDGDGIFVKGVEGETLDPDVVIPESHATASMYAYTPWVAEGESGNWLMWKILRRYADHVAQ